MMHTADAEISRQQPKTDPKTTTAILWSVAVYSLWTVATYLLENRMNLYQRPTVAGRYTYVLVANVALGTIGAVWVIRSLLRSGFLTPKDVGFRSVGRIAISILVAFAAGIIYVWFLQPASVPFLVTLNGCAQVLPVSIAEIVVCWALLGATFESLAKSKGKVVSVAAGILAASFFFSLYHIGHSAPFNQINMMLFLLVPGLITSLFWFVSRELYATILFHNFQGILGVIGNLKDPEILNRPLYPLYFLVFLSIIALLGAGRLLHLNLMRNSRGHI
ncbi:hypothetical protein EHM92_07025 [bacterium]|nr:MAG: hypothetical protein EHM92_07025 [bacterium]